MRNFKTNLFNTVFIVVMSGNLASATTVSLCAGIFASREVKTDLHVVDWRAQGLSREELSVQAADKITKIPEFAYIREQAEKRGLRVWLFGGTASSYLHYVKWDLQRQKGQKDFQADRFDYDFTNIFRSTQDLDIVIDATADKVREFQNALVAKYPYLLGAKGAAWEVRTLHARIGQPNQPGFKEALRGDEDFNNQNTDSNSLGMVEVTRSKEPVIRDLRHWDESTSPFLEDTLNNRISFFRSAKHFTTSRAKAGQNPEILSVTRLLVKAFQYELSFSDSDFKQMKSIVDAFNPQLIRDPVTIKRLSDIAKKLVMHATNIEYAMNKLDELGLRKKLIAMGNKDEQNSSSWWLNKEPLRSKPVGRGSGATAKSLNLQVVAHETNSFLAYESITRSHMGEPNVLISRDNVSGEETKYENGFYTQVGRIGARGTGLTVRFTVDPNAREGTDFIRHGTYVIFLNKNALKVIQESLNFGLDDLMKMAESNNSFNIDHSDLALIEKFKRRLNASRIIDELEKLLNSPREQDHEHLVHILSSFQSSSVQKFISSETLSQVVKNVYARIEPLYRSDQESQQIRYISTVGPILKILNAQGLLKSQDFFEYLDRVSESRGAGLAIRKLAAFERFLSNDNLELNFDFQKFLSRNELDSTMAEIKQWQHSADARKRKFAISLNQKWSEAIEKGDVSKLEEITKSGFFDINFKNISGYSILLLADYYGHKDVIRWLITKPDFDLNAKDAYGFNQVEQLKRLGKKELAAQIEQARPELRSREIHPKERNDDGSPIIGFVPVIKPGEQKSFMMGEGKDKVLVTLTESFDIMSTHTTQSQWRDVVNLLTQFLPGDVGRLQADPSNFKGATRPVERVSRNEIIAWIKGLNKLSEMDNEAVQASLALIFSNYKAGNHFRLPTGAEREFVQRNQGLAEGKFSFGNSETNLGDSAWFASNSGKQTHSVGQKKPIMMNGFPIYDIQGNVSEWVSDWYSPKILGGTDPKGPATSSWYTIYGASWAGDAPFLRSGYRSYYGADSNPYIGFRLVRTTK